MHLLLHLHLFSTGKLEAFKKVTKPNAYIFLSLSVQMRFGKMEEEWAFKWEPSVNHFDEAKMSRGNKKQANKQTHTHTQSPFGKVSFRLFLWITTNISPALPNLQGEGHYVWS